MTTFRLALHSRNEDLVRVLLDHLEVNKDNFGRINATFLDPLLLEAVELDDLESLQVGEIFSLMCTK